MKNEKVMDKLACVLASCKAKIVGLTATVMMAMPMMVSAGTVGSGTSDAGSIIGGVAEIVVNIFPFIGIFFVLAGVFKLVMAYRNDQPEAQSAAAKDIVIGAVFLAFRIFVWSALKGLLGL